MRGAKKVDKGEGVWYNGGNIVWGRARPGRPPARGVGPRERPEENEMILGIRKGE